MRLNCGGNLPLWLPAFVIVTAQGACRGADEAIAGQPSAAQILSRVADGREKLDAGDSQAVTALRAVAQDSLTTLAAAITAAEEAAGAGFETRTAARAAQRKARQAAASAHLAWGQAADRFGLRDEAATSLARALDLATGPAGAAVGESAELTDLQRDSRAALNVVLAPGLPNLVADDAIEIIAGQAHGKMWQPRRSTFALPATLSAPAFAHGRGAEKSAGVPAAAELLVTSGKLFPPENPAARNGNSRLSRVPPLYRAVPAESLPASLRMDRLVAGYVRETEGPNRGLWRQAVRVYYASTYQTQNNRDDRPRAEALCLQFLRAAALMRTGLGLTNLYNADGVTTVWLSEVSAWWPSDDEEPAIQQNLPVRMPAPNTPLRPQMPVRREVADTPLERPWRAAATLDSAPGDIIFFKMKQPRPEAEWLRQAFHEYGHVVVPPFDRFAPPLEPYGNGAIGEALGMMWAASIPEGWGVEQAGVAEQGEDISRELNGHTSKLALTALRHWQGAGPRSPLRADRTDGGLRYLTGLAVYLERTYGAPLLGRALAPLVRSGGGAARAGLSADSLLATSQNLLRDGIAPGTRQLAVWLGGVFDTRMTAQAVAARAPVKLADTAASGWIFVPARAAALTIVWQGGAASNLSPPGWTVKSSRRGEDGARLLTLSTANRSGWQRLALKAAGAVTITAAAFE